MLQDWDTVLSERVDGDVPAETGKLGVELVQHPAATMWICERQASQGARPSEPSPPPPTPPSVVPVADPPRKKDKKEKHANEAFIIVRPPPSKSAQPLSLQVQLVPPQSRNDRPVQALDSSPDVLDTDLRRTHSNGSEASAYSGYTSAGSVSSFASTSTSGSGRRMIIPLYNLNVHSVIPTTILDAGTDAKVAKFAKRGLEVIGLAFLEPIEVRSSARANGSRAASISARASFDDSLREFGSTPGTLPSHRPVSPIRPNTSHTPGAQFHTPTINLTIAPPLPPPDMQPERSTKKLFTRMFKKKSTPSPLSIAAPLPNEVVSPQPSPFHSTARNSDEAPPSQPDTPHTHDAWPSMSLISSATSQTAVLGVHSTLYPPVSNPRGRPTKYIWVVRKWLKGGDTSILNGVMGKLSVGVRDASVPNTPHIEVRFEWSREQKKGSGRKSRANKSSNARESPSPTRQVLRNTVPRLAPQALSPDARDHRISIISHNSSGSDTATSLGSSAHRHAEDSGVESDPEDSETPWTCAVTAQRLGHSLQHHQNGIQEVIRLKVATLSPTPHHPKVVGLLKMPFPLPDIEIERLVVRRRLVTAQGISKTTAPNTGEFVLTAEEIKDTVSSTALWLVVREAFGGVGRERKKCKS
ncbi:hypothetical protein HD554DRAFT_2168746 [Boletus coccyginus]|nr:hypothetical protein HD554DRAFT_2168746 [Boletus coccyginus]